MARYCLGPAAHRDPAKVALVVVHDPHDLHDAHHGGRGAQRWTFGELDTAVRATAAGLLERGVRPGDRVVLRLGNTADFPILWFGCMAAGIIGVPTSAQLTADEVAYVLADSGASALATTSELAVPTSLPTFGPEDLAQWRAAGSAGGGLAGAGADGYADTAADDAAYLVYTSGTSGRPKGVLHAHRAAWGRRPMYAGWYGLGRDDVMLHAGALTWTYTLGVGLTDPWAVGACAVVYDGPRDPGVWGRVIARSGATLFAAVPGVYRQWLRAGVDRGDIATLRHGLTAGEALAPGLYAAWRERTGLELYEALGMSEISTFVSSGPGTPVRPGSPGRPQPGRVVAVLPEHGGEEPVATGVVGVLAVDRADPGMMLGYWQRPGEEPWRGRWFVTADAVHLDDQGYVFHHGRVDDILNAGGYRVSPLEVEHVLAQHAAVAEVAVVEVVVREGVSVIAAYAVPAGFDAPHDPATAGPQDPPAQDSVAPTPQASQEPQERQGPLDLAAESVLAHARAHLAAYKCPRELVWVETLPRTTNGKVIRHLLRTPDAQSGS